MSALVESHSPKTITVTIRAHVAKHHYTTVNGEPDELSFILSDEAANELSEKLQFTLSSRPAIGVYSVVPTSCASLSCFENCDGKRGAI